MRRRRLPSLNALRAFEAAGRLGRMKLAAEELAVTHGAVSRKVRELEETLRVKLFEGPKNRLVLTESGRALLETLTMAFDAIEMAISSLVKEREEVLDVSCLGTLMMRWLIPRLYAFHDAYPTTDVRLSASDRPADFSRERYDVAIRIDDHPLPEDAEITQLFPDMIGPVLSPALVGRFSIKSPSDLKRVPLLRTRTRPWSWQVWTERGGVRLDAIAGREFEHFYFMLEAAASGLGACVASWPLVMDDISAGRLIAPFGFIPSGYNYVALRQRHRNRKAERFCEWLTTQAKETPPPPSERAAKSGQNIKAI